MKVEATVEFNDYEKAALEIVADIDCGDIYCISCPFYKRLSNAEKMY